MAGMYNLIMKKRMLMALWAALLLSACVGPVIREDLLGEGTRNVPLQAIAANPDAYKGKLFVLGGIIAKTTITDEGTVIEALYVPVDRKGYFKDVPVSGRYLAVWPKANGILDPMLYGRNRRITVAGTFEGMRKGKLGKTSYNFPVFEAVQIHLWKEEAEYPGYYYEPYYYGPYYPYPYYPYYSPYYPYYPYYDFGFGFEVEPERPGLERVPPLRPGIPQRPAVPERPGVPEVRPR